MIFAECVDITSMIGKVNYKDCFRLANKAAPVLANFSYCNKTLSSWLEESPDCIVSELVNNVLLIKS